MLLQDLSRLASRSSARSHSQCQSPISSCRLVVPRPCVSSLQQLRHSQTCRALPSGIATEVVLADAQPRASRYRAPHTDKSEDDDSCFPTEDLALDPSAPDVSFVSLVDGKFTVRGRLLLPASADMVYDMLTDYPSCHRVFSNIAASEVAVGADGSKEVIQSCRWTFLAFSGTFRVHLSVQEDPEALTLLFSLVQSSFMRDFEGRWTVRPAAEPPAAAGAMATPGALRTAAAGSDVTGWISSPSSSWCEVEHQLAVVPAVPVPPPVSYYTQSIFVRQVEAILLDLQRGVLAATEMGGAMAGPVAVTAEEREVAVIVEA